MSASVTIRGIGGHDRWNRQVYGLLADSLALIADAGHNLSDVLSLLLAWGAAWLATRRPPCAAPTVTGV